MNIVHWGKFYPPHHGGIESVTAGLAEGSAVAGHDVTVVCFDQQVQQKTVEVRNGVKVERAPMTMMRSSQPVSWVYWWAMMASFKRADVVHAHSPNYLALLGLLFVPKRVQCVLHWHSDVIGKGWLARLLRPLEQAALRRADVVICTSPPYAAFSESLRPWQAKIKIVPIGVEAPKELVQQPLPHDLMMAIRGRPIVLSIGRLVPYKGFGILIQAASHLCTNAVVVVVGSGPLQDELAVQIREAGLSDKVILAGRLSDHDLSALFQHASVYCMTSTDRAEAFGVVLAEAMSYGLPIVAPKIIGSGVPWVNQHQKTGLNVAVGDSIGFANACDAILENPDLHAQYSAASFERYQQVFALSRSVAAMLQIYSECHPVSH